MIASLSSSPSTTFEELVDKYNNNLPKDVLTTAPASSVFIPGTSGCRYLELGGGRSFRIKYISRKLQTDNIN